MSSSNTPSCTTPELCPSVVGAKHVNKANEMENKVIAARLSDMEARHTDLVRSVDGKLDKLMGLTNIVASLQERMIHQADDLTEVRGSLKEMDKSIRAGLEKAHDRINEVNKELGDKITSLNKEIKDQIEGVQKHVATVEATSSKWINRITGGVAVLSLVIGIIQWFVLDYISSARHREEEYRSKISDLERKTVQLEFTIARDLNNRPIIEPKK